MILEATTINIANELKNERRKHANKRHSANFWKRQEYKKAHQHEDKNRELTNMKRRQNTAMHSPKVPSFYCLYFEREKDAHKKLFL